jgi:hypothetical protein
MFETREGLAKAAFLESTPWSEIILMAGADLDDILHAYYMGRSAEADRMIEAAKEKAWQAWQEKEAAEVGMESRMAIEFEEYMWRCAA